MTIKFACVTRVIFLLLIGLAVNSPALASIFYDFDIITKTGDVDGSGNTITAINGQTVTLNDSGMVAFAATNDLGQSLYIGDGSAPPIIISFPTPGTRTYHSGVQINNGNQVIARDRSGATNLIRVWEGNTPGIFTTVVRGNVSGGTPTFPAAYSSVFSHPTLSNVPLAATDPFVAFSALDIDLPQPNTVLATPNVFGATQRFNFNEVQLDSPLRPMIADNGDIVVRAGSLASNPIRLYRNNLAASDIIANNASFSVLGRSPGISADANGSIVMFYGELTAAGAGNINAVNSSINYGVGNVPTLDPLVAGKGIFASINTTGGRIVVRVAGLAGNNVLDPGETFIDTNGNSTFDAGENDIGPFASFGVDDRVAVNNTASLQRAATIAFLATDSAGNKGLYTTRLNIFGTGVGAFNAQQPGEFTVHPPTLVAEQGESITGLPGTVSNIDVYDQLNSHDRGELAFWVQMSGGEQAVVRARHQEVVFLDFDPVNNYTLGPSACGLFLAFGESLTDTNGNCTHDAGEAFTDGNGNGVWDGVNPGWAGNMSQVFSTLSPARADLNGAANLALIQDAIVDGTQAAFDDVNPPNARDVNVKVLGKVADTVPADGPFMRIYLGDGPHNAANPDATAGIADSDIFNSNEGLQNGNFVYNFETPLIFIDNIFRLSNQFFTSQAGVASVAVSLNQNTGPSMILRNEVVNAIVSTTAHEASHSFGLQHLSNALNTLIMNAFVSSPLSDGTAIDELRTLQTFGNALQQLEPTEFAPSQENSGARLAFAAGSTDNAAQLSRDAPNAVVQASEGRVGFRIGANVGFPQLLVAGAGLGIVPRGNPHLKPEFINLGAGDLAQLLNRDIQVRPGDQVLLIASTTRNGIDVFGVAPDFPGNVGSIDLSSQLLVMTEPEIRGDIFNNLGQPAAVSLNIYQSVAGVPLLLGNLGSPNAVGIPVPDVVGLAQAVAELAITGAGLTVGTIITQNSATVAAGDVISQNPAAGTNVSAGSAVDLVVSLGPALVAVPGVVGQAQAAATAAITGAGLTVGTITTQNSATVPAGDVISQNPAAGTNVSAGSAVDLVVSLGPAPIPVPGVVGQAQAAAETAIIGAGLTVGTITTQNSATVPAGDVISQNPAAGTNVSTGSAVDLVVSLGPALSIPGDLDGDGDVDRDDLSVIISARNTPASGPSDPRDLDGDGTITVLDARKLMLLCTRSRCATS